MPELMRTCIHCGQTKPIYQFAKTNTYYRKDGSTINWRKHTCYTCKHSKKGVKGGSTT